MDKLNDISTSIMHVQEALNEMEIKGRKNAALLIYAVDRCTEVLSIIKEMSKESTNNMEETEHEQQNH